MLRRKWTFLVVAIPLLASLYLPAQGAAAPTDLEKRLLGCATDCATAEDRYTALALLGSIRTSAGALNELDRLSQASVDPLAKVLASYALYKRQSYREGSAAEFVAAVDNPSVRGQLWLLAIEKTQYPNIIDFWGSLADIAVYNEYSPALKALFEMAPQSDGGEAEAINDSIVSALVAEPEQTLQMMEKMGADKKVLKGALASALDEKKASELANKLRSTDIQSPYRDLIMDDIKGQ